MKKTIFSMICFIILLALTFTVPVQNPKTVNLDNTLAPASSDHLLGTDNLGRDVFSLILIGLRRTSAVVVAAALTSVTFGTLVGILGAYYGGAAEIILRLFADISLITPSFIAALIISAIFGANPVVIGVSIGFCDIGSFANQAGALTKKVLNEEFIIAERLLGLDNGRLMFRHILPSIITPILTSLGSKAGQTILSYASLTFIGLGTDITNPDWGSMIYQYRYFIVEHPSLLLWPSLAILLLSSLFYIAFDNRSFAIRKRGQVYDD